MEGLLQTLCSAALQGDLARLRALLATPGVDVNSQLVRGWTALHLAAIHGHTACLEALLGAGASANSVGGRVGWTPLHLASHKGREACVRALIAAGADVNLACTTNTNYDNDTPFTQALKNGHTRVLKVLLRAGAEIRRGNAISGFDGNKTAWALVDAIRRLGGWPNYVRRRRGALGLWVMRRLPEVTHIEIAAFIELPGGD